MAINTASCCTPMIVLALLTVGVHNASAAPNIDFEPSSVTLYGRLDNGFEYLHGIAQGNSASGTRWRGQSGDWGTSMLGLKGVETLGQGAAILFHLEQGLNTMNGTVGGEGGFNRWASIGYQNKTWGTLSAGRMLWISNGVWDFDPFVQEAWSSASLVRGRNWPQSSQNIRYESPSIGGFDIEWRLGLSNQVHFNEGAPGHRGRATGVQLTYTSSYFQIRGIADEIRDAHGQFSDLFQYSRETVLAANTQIGPFKLQMAYTHLSARAARSAPFNEHAPTAADYEWFGVSYPVNAYVAITAGGFHINANGDGSRGGGAATMFEIGTTAALSKRTFVYLTLAQVRNSAGAAYGLSPTPIAAPEQAPQASGARYANDAPLPGHTQSGAYVGINHTF